MTNERAINVINDYLCNNDMCSCSGENCLHVSCKECRREAGQMAIEALKERCTLVKISKTENLEKLENIIKNSPMMFIIPDTEKIELIREQQWIPCSERLPEYDKDVLCYTDADEFIVGHRVDNWEQDAWITGEFGAGEFNAIAWMALPEPYNEKE